MTRPNADEDEKKVNYSCIADGNKVNAVWKISYKDKYSTTL